MKIDDTVMHRRCIYVRIEREELSELIAKIVAERLGISIATLLQHGTVTILDNTEGSPPYRAGYCAQVEAAIPLEGDWTNNA